MLCLPVGGGLHKFSPYCLAFHLRSLPLSPESLSPPRSLVHSGGSPQPPTFQSCLFPFFSAGPQGFSPFPLTNTRSGSPLPLLLPAPFPSYVPLSLTTCDCFLLPPKWDWCVLTWAFQFFELFEFCVLYLGYSVFFFFFGLIATY